MYEIEVVIPMTGLGTSLGSASHSLYYNGGHNDPIRRLLKFNDDPLH
jgi:hypothetical protein